MEEQERIQEEMMSGNKVQEKNIPRIFRRQG
jgi:hypothetical protein